MKPTIDDLLKALSSPTNVTGKKTLDNNKETWERIANKDTFSELGLENSELQNFLKEWISDNEYSNIN